MTEQCVSQSAIDTIDVYADGMLPAFVLRKMCRISDDFLETSMKPHGYYLTQKIAGCYSV